MDEIAKALIGSSPVLVVVLLLGDKAIGAIKEIAKDWRVDRLQSANERAQIMAWIQDTNRRVGRLEEDAFGERSPTQPKRPANWIERVDT